MLTVNKANWQFQQSEAMKDLGVPPDYERPLISSEIKGNENCDIGSGLNLVLKEFALNEGISIFSILLASFNALLSFYTREKNVGVASILKIKRTKNKTKKNANPDLVALRTEFKSEFSGREQLKQTAKNIEDSGLGGRYTSGETLNILFAQKFDSNSLSIFNAAFVFSNSNIAKHPGVDDFRDQEYLIHCDLVVHIHQNEDDMNLYCEFDSEIFASATIRRLLRHLRVLLMGFVLKADEAAAAITLPMLPWRQNLNIQCESNSETPTNEMAYSPLLHQVA